MNVIKNGDSTELLPLLPDNSVDLITTSPPYKDEDNFSFDLIDKVFGECFRVLKQDSLCFLNFGHLANDKDRPFEVWFHCKQQGFKLNDTFIWVKNHYKPIQGKRRVNNLFEYIFLMYKGNMPELNRLSIGVPYVDISNAKRFSNGNNLKCQGNVWKIPYDTIQKKEQKLHNDRFPVGLPDRAIKLSGIKEGSVVLDCFGGSGTTGIAAIRNKMEYILFEKSISHYERAVERLNNERI